MKCKITKIAVLMLVIALLISCFAPFTTAFAVVIAGTPTGYTTASDVEYVKDGKYVANWGARGEKATFLTTYAKDFYTGSYTYENLSTYSGGTSQSNAHNSSLYAQLKSLMSSKQTYQTSYDATKSLFCYTDCVNSDYDYISSFYSGTRISGSWDGTWNREHTWPDSKGDASGNGENDITMLRPTAISENSSRGNTAYGESSVYYDPDSERPPASLRGDCARIVLFVYTRWGNTGSMWGSSGVIESMDVLLKWMEEDPVDTWEMGRNDAVQSITGTRNAYVDYPEFAWQLFGKEVPESVTTPSGSDNGGVQVEQIIPSTYSLTMTPNQMQQLTVIAEPVGASKSVTFASEDTSVATVDANGNVTAKAGGSTRIVITSKVRPEIKAYVYITVKTVSSITVSGTPTTTNYNAGQQFDPSGLQIEATYADGTTGTLLTTDCLWLDGVTGEQTLSAGTTTVTCKFGELTQTVSGITVRKVTTQTVTITLDSFTNGKGYAFHSFTSGEVTGKAYIYHEQGNWQFNNKKDYAYLFGQAPAPITSITVYTTGSTKEWELRTSDTAYQTNVGQYPTTGTSYGKKDVTSSGTTWDLTGNSNNYFTLNYTDSSTGVCYLSKITITYGETDSVTLSHTTAELNQGDEFTLTATATGDVTWSSSDENVVIVENGVLLAGEKGTATITATCGSATATCVVTVKIAPCDVHTETEWIVDKQATCKEQGSRHKECTVCERVTQTETLEKTTDHTNSEWIVVTPATCQSVGSKHIVCTVCGVQLQTDTIAQLQTHTEGNWITDTPATCQSTGSKHTECTVCGVTINTEVIPLSQTHSAGSWIVDTPATCQSTGSKHTVCTVCGVQLQTATVAKLDHTPSSWITDIPATCTATGSKHTECTQCEETIQTATVAKLEHTFGNWIVTVQPTTSAQGTQTRSCSVCGFAETQAIPVVADITAFVNAVDAIDNCTSLKEKFVAIKSAITLYNSYSDAQKQLASQPLSKLKAHIQTYNNEINQQNHNVTSTFNGVVASLSATVVAMAVLYLLKRSL